MSCQLCGKYLCGDHALQKLHDEFPMFATEAVLRAAAEAQFDAVMGTGERELILKGENEDVGKEYQDSAAAALYAALDEIGIDALHGAHLRADDEGEEAHFQRIWHARLRRIWEPIKK